MRFPHLSYLQLFNTTRNADAVSRISVLPQDILSVNAQKPWSVMRLKDEIYWMINGIHAEGNMLNASLTSTYNNSQLLRGNAKSLPADTLETKLRKVSEISSLHLQIKN